MPRGKKKTVKRKEKVKERLEVKGWRALGEKGENPKMRNIKYTAKENEAILEAVRLMCSERNKTAEELGLLEESQAGRGKVWVRVGFLAEQLGMETRSVQSISQRYRRIVYQQMGGEWTAEQVEQLADMCVPYASIPDWQPGWKHIGSSIGKSPEMCRDKWKSILGGGRNGKFSTAEDWLLRQAVVEATAKLTPVRNIPWDRVAKLVPERTMDSCRRHWYMCLLPRLLDYQSKHGIPIDGDVFERAILRGLRKAGVTDIELVNWADVNTFWSAPDNKRRYARLRRRLPDELFQYGPFEEEVAWLFESLSVKAHRKRDKKVLKHAVTVLEAEARLVSDCEEEEAAGEDAVVEVEEEEEAAKARKEARKKARKLREREAQAHEELVGDVAMALGIGVGDDEEVDGPEADERGSGDDGDQSQAEGEEQDDAESAGMYSE